MPKVVYAGAAGDQRSLAAEPGESVMAAAVRSGVPGLIGECGGSASCATWHVRVREELFHVPPVQP